MYMIFLHQLGTRCDHYKYDVKVQNEIALESCNEKMKLYENLFN